MKWFSHICRFKCCFSNIGVLTSLEFLKLLIFRLPKNANIGCIEEEVCFSVILLLNSQQSFFFYENDKR